MSTLSRYILKKFLKPFVASFTALCILIFVSQLFDRLDRFLSDGVSLSHVLGFLITSLPSQAMQMLPISCLLATLFVVGNLSRSREYIAGLAGGIPPEKFLSGLFWAGVSLSFIAFIASETIVPPTSQYSRTVFREKIRRLGEWRARQINDLVVSGQEGRLWNIKTFDEGSGNMTRVIVDTFQEGRAVDQIDALSALWSKDGWTFEKGFYRSFRPDGLTIDKSEIFESRIFLFKENPSDFVIGEPEPEEMTYSGLKRHIHRLSSLGIPVRSLEVDLMSKLAFPITCLVVIFLGVPLALKSGGSRAMGIAAGGVLTLIYMGFIQFGRALAQRHLPPFLGAWLGNIIFTLIGFVLWFRMRRNV